MKTAWALGAAFVAVVLALFVFGVFAAKRGSAERLSSTETLEGIDVPTIGTVGDFPDPAHRHVINVSADGRVAVEGRRPATYGELVGVLNELARLSDGEPIPGTKRFLSGESFVIRADAASAWRDALAVDGACAEVFADRIFFAVRHETDGTVGALAAFLPTDIGCMGAGDVARRISMVPGEGGAEPAAVFASVRAEAKGLSGRVAVAIDAAGEVTTGTVLAWLDAALRAGAPFSGFAYGTRIPKPADPIPVPGAAATSRVGVRWGCDEFGERGPDGFVPDPGVALAAAPAMPAVGRVRGAFAGQADSYRPSHH